METKEQELKNAFAQGSVASTTDILLKLLYLGSGIIVARSLGAEGKGIYSLITTFVGLGSIVGLIGINFAHVYLLSSRRYSLELIVKDALFFTAINSTIIILIAYLTYPLVGLDKIVGVEYFPFIAVMIVCFIFDAHVSAILLGQERIARLRLLSLVIPTITVIALMGILFYPRVDKDGISYLVVALALSTVAGSLVYVHQLFSLTERPIVPGVNRRLMKDSITYGLKNWAGNLFSQLTYRLDYFLVQILASTAQLGYYSVAVSISQTLLFIPGAFSSILLPKFARYEKSYASAAAATAIRHTLALSLFLAVTFAILGHLIIRFLYGAQFLPASTPLLILLPGVLAMSLAGIALNYFAGRNRPEIPSYILLGGLILNTSLDFCLIPRLGIVGASIASTIAYTSIAIVSLCLFRKDTSIGLFKMFILRPNDISRLWHILRKREVL